MGSQRKKIQEMFAVSAQIQDRLGGGLSKISSVGEVRTFYGTTHCT